MANTTNVKTKIESGDNDLSATDIRSRTMRNKFLQEFLIAGLFEIGDNDERLDQMTATIEALEKQFEADSRILPNYTLVALDPNIGDDDPALIATEDILMQYWKALRSKYPQRPVPILRAIILHALYNVGMNDTRKAAVIYLTASNFYPFAEFQKEKAIVSKILIELGEQVEQVASQHWQLIGFEDNIKLPSLKIGALKLQIGTINNDQLKAGMKSSLANTTQGHSFQHGWNSPWGDQFADRSSNAIASAIKEAVSPLSIPSDGIETPVNKFFTEFKKSFDETLKVAFNSITVMGKRNDLLWWKESLYSVSLKIGYRELNNNVLPLAMAYDLSGLIAEIPPASVDSLLKESVLQIDNEAYKETTFESWLGKLVDPKIKAVASEFVTTIQTQGQRVNFYHYLGLLINGVTDIASFKSLTGIDPKAITTPASIAVALFHDFVAESLTLNG